MKKILIVASIPCEKYNCQFGGATVLVRNMLDFMDENNIVYDLVVTNKFVDKKSGEELKYINRIYYIFLFFVKIFFCDTVVFQYSDHAVVHLFPFLQKFSTLMGKKVVLRKFGGSFDSYLSKCKRSAQIRVLKSLQSTNLIFFETKSGINFLKSFDNYSFNISWLPNIRKPYNGKLYTKHFNYRLAFMSHIRDEKGIREILEVAKRLPHEYTIDLFGAIKDPKYLNFNWSDYNVKYHGQISSSDVLELLPTYSLILLPSYKEGYPGIIIEAMSVGVPSIASNIGGIPEIIDNGINGILINPRSASELEAAILSVNDDTFKKYSKNALSSFEHNFNSNTVNKRVIQEILAL